LTTNSSYPFARLFTNWDYYTIYTGSLGGREPAYVSLYMSVVVTTDVGYAEPKYRGGKRESGKCGRETNHALSHQNYEERWIFDTAEANILLKHTVQSTAMLFTVMIFVFIHILKQFFRKVSYVVCCRLLKQARQFISAWWW